MKRLVTSIIAFALQMLVSAPNVNAQGTVVSAPVVKHAVVSVRIRVRDAAFDAKFDTDGQTIGGFTEADLNKKFSKVNSGASIVNFVAQNGYKIIGFSSTQGGIGAGISEGSNGYMVLFEQIR